MIKQDNIIRLAPLLAPLAYRGLACMRGGRLLFSELDFTLEAGGALGVFGANGAGKSSLLRGLAGFLHIEGKLPPLKQAMLHYIGHHNGLKASASVDEMLMFYKTIMCSPKGGNNDITTDIATDIKKLRLDIGLGAYGATRISDLSVGQRRRCALARLLLAPRPLWLLDEPFAGLDEQGRHWFSQTLTDYLAAGGRAVIASHNEAADFFTHKIHLGKIKETA